MYPRGERNVEVPSVCQAHSPLPWSKSDILWERFKRDTNKSLLLEPPWTLLGFGHGIFDVLKPASQSKLISIVRCD